MNGTRRLVAAALKPALLLAILEGFISLLLLLGALTIPALLQ